MSEFCCLCRPPRRANHGNFCWPHWRGVALERKRPYVRFLDGESFRYIGHGPFICPFCEQDVPVGFAHVHQNPMLPPSEEAP